MCGGGTHGAVRSRDVGRADERRARCVGAVRDVDEGDRVRRTRRAAAEGAQSSGRTGHGVLERESEAEAKPTRAFIGWHRALI